MLRCISAAGIVFALHFCLLADEPAVPKPAEKLGQSGKNLSHKFVRLQRNADRELVAMQTAIVSYRKPGEQKGVCVDLVGAVHVGEKEYYDALNKAFENYDVVLYELVAPEGTRIPKGSKTSNRNLSGAVQNGLKGVLDLEHQLESIDYTRENMVHADMSPAQFQQSMKDRGESVFGMMFKMMGQGMAQQSRAQAKGANSFEGDMMAALFSSNRPLAMKRAFAEQFQNMEASMGAFTGKDGSTIITERNKVALQKLDEAIQAGKQKIAIFYGAGHLPDIEARLLSDFGLERREEHWLTAWNLADKPATAK